MKVRVSRSVLLFTALSTATAVVLWQTRALPPRSLLPAVEAEAFTLLTGRAAASTPELWERLKVMGVAAVVLREETAAELVARGEALHFSRAEIEKWRLLGFISAGGGPQTDSLWAKDAKILARLPGSLRNSSSPALVSLDLPLGADLTQVSAGFDPETVAAVSAAGLIPVAASTRPFVSVAGHKLWIRSVPAAARPSEILRTAYARAQRLLIFRLSADVGIEKNLEQLRAALKIIKNAGLLEALPASEPSASMSRLERSARIFLLYAIGLLGPLLAMRSGLSAERKVRGWVAARAPIAAPVPEIAAGLAVVLAAASIAGLLAVVAAGPEVRQAFARNWTLWTLSAPLVVGAIALFISESRALRACWRSPLRVCDLVIAFALTAVLFGLLTPRETLRFADLWERVDRFSIATDALWWWPWRWREIFIGTPSLVLALILVGRRKTATQDDAGTFFLKVLVDPRGWLIVGLLAPAGAVAAIGAGGAPPLAAIAHGAVACVCGAALGFLLAGLRSRMEEWVLRPSAY